MAKVTVIFVGGDTPIDNVIKTVTQGQYSHAAILSNGIVYEALGMPDKEDPNPDPYAGVWKHRGDKYTGNPNAKFIEVDLPDKAAADAWAEKKIGTKYAYGGCVIGAIHDTTGANIEGDGEETMNCSEFVTRYLRSGNLDLLHGLWADGITPMDDERALEGTA